MENEEKPIYKKWWFWVIIVILIFTIIGNSEDMQKGVNDGMNTSTNNMLVKEKTLEENVIENNSKENINFIPETTNSNTSEINSTTSMVTLGEKNALSKAIDYLAYSSFSYKSLLEQLEFEGFTTEEATYGVDNCGADWNEQAVKKAKDYMKYSSFSKNSLIEQLEFEGFTHDQAVYGATSVGY